MKDNYDFINGQRGKFYRSEAIFNLPVYLNNDVPAYLNKRADSKGLDVDQLINDAEEGH